ncbi:MAG: ligase-associated DNA damage response endonuclease PdeM [Gemmatimonadaceae bacterium]|jgi:DNA ligase-associated metallophosphoesterase|nr:ligase-associated DNA damage response endonuclease PdeM [Gemmatimonadaceae bacterium]
MLTIDLAGEPAHLLPDRALHLPVHDALLVADVHWGKAAAFRADRIPVPRGTTTDDLERLDALLEMTAARRLLVLGDLLHARTSLPAETRLAIEAWRARHPRVEIVLVRGNHDERAGDPPAVLDIACVDAPYALGPFRLHHFPTEVADGYALAGHVHPRVQLHGRGRQRLALPCFVFGERSGLLPSFGSFTGGAIVDPAPGARVYAIADGEVLAVTPSALSAAHT